MSNKTFEDFLEQLHHSATSWDTLAELYWEEKEEKKKLREQVKQEILLQDRVKEIYSLSFAAWEQVDKNPEEAKRLFRKIHSIASDGEYMMEHPSFYPENNKPDEDVLDDEEEALLNKLCDVVENELSSSYPYDRERTKKIFQKILDGE